MSVEDEVKWIVTLMTQRPVLLVLAALATLLIVVSVFA